MPSPDRSSLTDAPLDPELQRKWFPSRRRTPWWGWLLVLATLPWWGWLLIPILLWAGIVTDDANQREQILGPVHDRQMQQEAR